MLVRFATLMFAVGLAGAAQAQGPAQTGTGGGPTSTIYAPNTTAVGQTKPPGSAAGPTDAEQGDRLDKIERKNDSIQNGICIGCDK